MSLTGPAARGLAPTSRKVKEARRAFSEQELKAYFTAPALGGLFKIIETLRGVHLPRYGTGMAPRRREFYRIERNGQPGSVHLDQPARTGKRAAPGWTTCAIRAGSALTRGVAKRPSPTGLQLQGRWTASPPVDARRRDHAVPRIWSWTASHADPGERTRCLRHRRGRMGRRGAAQPVHGKLLLGMGAAAHDRPRGHRRPVCCRARCSTR